MGNQAAGAIKRNYEYRIHIESGSAVISFRRTDGDLPGSNDEYTYDYITRRGPWILYRQAGGTVSLVHDCTKGNSMGFIHYNKDGTSEPIKPACKKCGDPITEEVTFLYKMSQ